MHERDAGGGEEALGRSICLVGLDALWEISKEIILASPQCYVVFWSRLVTGI